MLKQVLVRRDAVIQTRRERELGCQSVVNCNNLESCNQTITDWAATFWIHGIG